MTKRCLLVALLSILVGWGTAGMAQADPTVSFYATDNPGTWFECANTGTPPSPGAPISASGLGCLPEADWLGTVGLKSLAVIQQGESVGFPSLGGKTRTVHTAIPLIYPTGALSAPPISTFHRDVDLHAPVPIENQTITLNTPGLYVFICDIHVYMFAGVIVVPTGHSYPDTIFPLDLGQTLDLPLVRAGGSSIVNMPTASDLALRLVRTFFIITNPNNWQSYPASGTAPWNPTYPNVPVKAYPDGSSEGVEINLNDLMDLYFEEPTSTLAAPVPPTTPGVGQVWVNTQFEKMLQKNKPGTATAVNADSWKVERKVGLPQINMNNPHNMWTDKNQEVIYQTQWFDEILTVFDRKTGAFKWNRDAGPAPSHVMTRANNDEVHVAQNGGDNVMEYKSLADGNGFIRAIPMDETPGHTNTNPHGHWMSADGMKMVTPNERVATSTVYNFSGSGAGSIEDTIPVGHAPLATGMMPDGSKYYVADFLDSTLSVINMNDATPRRSTPIHLLANYANPFKLKCGFLGTPPPCAQVTGSVGGLPIQTPVSPDGRFVVTANTLTATITIVDTDTDQVVAELPCDPGCHGVNFGAKKGGGYYAYVANKFSNRMIVVDPDPNGAALPNDGSNAVIAGTVLLTEGNKSAGYQTDGTVRGLAGMGGQGVLAVPNVYNGWVQQWVENCTNKDCRAWKRQLTADQQKPIEPPAGPNPNNGKPKKKK